MLILVCGGAASGKSELAESLTQYLGNKKLYIATMRPYGGEAAAKIKRHRKMRNGKGFESMDRYTDLKGLVLGTKYDVIMLECVLNLMANEMFSENGNPEEVLTGIMNLSRLGKHLVVVSGCVGYDGENYSSETKDYIANIETVNAALAKSFDVAVEVVAGIPIYHKGGNLIEKLN